MSNAGIFITSWSKTKTKKKQTINTPRPSLHGQVLGALCPVVSQWAVLSLILAHEADSHHKAPIVFTGWIGSHSVCHSAATCITRRHSGACFCFWFVLSCQRHRAALFCLRAYWTLIWEIQPKAPHSSGPQLQIKLIYVKTIVAAHFTSHGRWSLAVSFVREGKGFHVPKLSHGWCGTGRRQRFNRLTVLWL